MAKVTSDISRSLDGFITGPTRVFETRSAMTGAASTLGCSTPRPMLMLRSSTRSTRQRERF
jgi:hypothetical protein